MSVRAITILLSSLILIATSAFTRTERYRAVPDQPSDTSAECVQYHEAQMPGLVKEWRINRHYGANIGCYECHGAKEGDPDAVEHNGCRMSVIVSPKD